MLTLSRRTVPVLLNWLWAYFTFEPVLVMRREPAFGPPRLAALGRGSWSFF